MATWVVMGTWTKITKKQNNNQLAFGGGVSGHSRGRSRRRAESAATASFWVAAFPVAAEATLTSTPYYSCQVQSIIV